MSNADFFASVVSGRTGPATSRAEVAAILAQAVYQDFNDPSGGTPIHWPSNAMPAYWRRIDEHNVPIQPGAREDSQHHRSDPDLGPSDDYPFAMVVPEGFRIVNRTHNRDNKQNGGADHAGYDAVAVYNERNGELMVVNLGLNEGSRDDMRAAADDGGNQIPEAQHFLDDTLSKLATPPRHVTLVGHSLGGVLAASQSVQLIRHHNNPPLPFSVIAFDSIGTETYLARDHVSVDERAAIQQNYMAFQGSGKFATVFGVPVEEMKMKSLYREATGHNAPDHVTTHFFNDPLASGLATVMHDNKASHDMKDLAAPFFNAVASARGPNNQR